MSTLQKLLKTDSCAGAGAGVRRGAPGALRRRLPRRSLGSNHARVALRPDAERSFARVRTGDVAAARRHAPRDGGDDDARDEAVPVVGGALAVVPRGAPDARNGPRVGAGPRRPLRVADSQGSGGREGRVRVSLDRSTYAARIFRRRVAATPRLRRGYSVETSRGDAAAARWIFCGDGDAAAATRNSGRDRRAPQVPLKDALIALDSLNRAGGGGGALPWGVTEPELQALDDRAAAEVALLLGIDLCGNQSSRNSGPDQPSGFLPHRRRPRRRRRPGRDFAPRGGAFGCRRARRPRRRGARRAAATASVRPRHDGEAVPRGAGPVRPPLAAVLRVYYCRTAAAQGRRRARGPDQSGTLPSRCLQDASRPVECGWSPRRSESSTTGRRPRPRPQPQATFMSSSNRRRSRRSGRASRSSRSRTTRAATTHTEGAAKHTRRLLRS